MILLDTNVLITPPQAWPDDDFGASMLTLAELHFGIEHAKTPVDRLSRTERVNRYRSSIEWIPFDEYAAEAYGKLASQVASSRSAHARRADIFIAAQAYALNVPLMTRNIRDFELIEHMVEIIGVAT
ncbi:MAG TPA: PIN domain-containing protein [Microbacteriaceae bacterium]